MGIYRIFIIARQIRNGSDWLRVILFYGSELSKVILQELKGEVNSDPWAILHLYEGYKFANGGCYWYDMNRCFDFEHAQSVTLLRKPCQIPWSESFCGKEKKIDTI